MDMDAWARKWDIPQMAMVELRRAATNDPWIKPPKTATTPEAVVQHAVRMEAATKGGLLMRNNVGALLSKSGRLVRYGLANDSKGMNKKTKSSDLIGPMPTLITPGMVGSTVGVFTARECKRGGWTYRGTDEEKAQLNFINIILSLGGNACFAAGEGTL